MDSPDPLFYIDGICGREIFISPNADLSDKTLLVDIRQETLGEPHYLTYNQLDKYSSVNVWKDVNKAIVDDDSSLADKLKKVVEQDQRDLRKMREEKGLTHEGKYFTEVDSRWVYKGNFDLDTLSSNSKEIEPAFDGSEASDDDILITNDSPNSVDNESPLDENSNSRLRSRSEGSDNKAILSSESDDIPVSSIEGSGVLSDSEGKPRRDSSSTSLRTKKEIRAEKKKVREEQKQVKKTMKMEKKNNAYTSLSNIIMSGPVMMRNSLKRWKEKWFVLVPGKLIYFRSKSEFHKENCEGIILLEGCNVRERPSKKLGYCFKVYNLLQYSIYSRQGLKGEAIKRAMIPVSADYLILLVNEAPLYHEWVRAIKSAIPDYEKIKSYMASTLGIDSESEEDELDSETSKVDNIRSSLGSDLRPNESGEEALPDESLIDPKGEEIIYKGDNDVLINSINQTNRRLSAALNEIKELKNSIKMSQNALIMEMRNASKKDGNKDQSEGKGGIAKMLNPSAIAVIIMFLMLLISIWRI